MVGEELPQAVLLADPEIGRAEHLGAGEVGHLGPVEEEADLLAREVHVAHEYDPQTELGRQAAQRLGQRAVGDVIRRSSASSARVARPRSAA